MSSRPCVHVLVRDPSHADEGIAYVTVDLRIFWPRGEGGVDQAIAALRGACDDAVALLEAQ